MDISIGILAGGKSSRMGKNKAFLNYHGMTFLDNIIEEFSSFDDLIISVDKKDKWDLSSHTVVEDESTEIGPVEGIYQILKKAKNEFVFVCATDMPFIKKELALYMAEFISSDYDCYLLEDSTGTHPLCSIYSKKAIPFFKESIDSGKYRILCTTDKLRTKKIRLEDSRFSSDIIQNINTVQDYETMVVHPVISIAGVKNSGKTTLITNLIPRLHEKFEKIALIKHDAHNFNIDHEGTDTYKYMVAGADKITIYSSTQHATMTFGEKFSVEDALMELTEYDLVIIEGLKYGSYPIIELVRDGNSRETVSNIEARIAVATNIENFKADVPVLNLNNYDEITDFICKYFSI